MKRPWGWMIKILDLGFFWVKLIRVYTRTSLQYHRERTELHLSLYKVKYVPVFQVHRMTRGWYIEIAWGRPREEDIVRLEDDFGRV